MSTTTRPPGIRSHLPRPPRESDFTSPVRSTGLTARVGLLLGICFGLAFVTGVISHELHATHSWLPLPSRPAWGYRVTQGLHVASGTAAIPLLLVKLWSVFPKLFAEVPLGRPSLARAKVLGLHLAERGSIAVLVAGSILEVSSGLANTAQWYPWAFSFRATHYALAYVVIGALVLHIAVKLPVIRTALGASVDEPAYAEPGGAPSRRALLRTTVLASGVAVLASAGSAVPLLRRVSVFGVRDGSGPEGLPVNKSARAADVTATALAPAYRLTVQHGDTSRVLSRADLAALPQRTHDLPIACVEGWSADATWTGVRLRDLLDLVDAPHDRAVRVTSLQQHGPFAVTELPGNFADDPLTLLALGLNGETLSIDHGYPCRLIAPNRPGVLQTKWVTRLEVL